MADTQTVIAAFTEMAARYEQTVDRELRQFWGIGYEEFIGRLLERIDLANAGAVLDVATGRAVIPLALLQLPDWSGNVVGVDITPQMLEGAAQQVPAGESDRVRLVCGSGMMLPFTDNSFDAAICALATHHMDVSVLLWELNRVLRPGGQLLIADVALADLFRTRIGHRLLHALAWWFGRREGETRGRAEKAALVNMRTPDEWRAFLLSSGFSGLELAAVPARYPWYPPGILVRAYSDKVPGAGNQ